MTAPTRYSKTQTCPGVPLPANFDTLPVLSRSVISSRISQGELLIIHLPLVLQLPLSWLANHPGGDLALLHFVGRDASNEIEVYHSGYTVAKRMAHWVVGKVEVGDEGWQDMVPPLHLHCWPVPALKQDKRQLGATCDFSDAHLMPDTLTPEMIDPPRLTDGPLTPSYQHHLRLAHRELHQKLHSLGLFDLPSRLSGYDYSLIGYAILFALWISLYIRAETWVGYLVAGCAMGLWWHQVTFVAHDAGHSGITQDWWTDRLFCTAVANGLGGLSAGWWADSHNVHHLCPNAPEHDPDIQLLPFFAISNRFFEAVRSSYRKQVITLDAAAQFLLPYQHQFYYLVMAVARFNLFRESYTFLYRTQPHKGSPLHRFKLLEITALGVFWTWYGFVIWRIPTNVSRVLFILAAFVFSSPVHVQIVLSHLSQPVEVLEAASPQDALQESFMHRQLRTTMDVACPAYLDWVHGGLNQQVSHHLFPRLPRFRFRAAQAVVAEWVAGEQARLRADGGLWRGAPLKEGDRLEYKTMTFVDGNRDVLRHLRDIANQVSVLRLVAHKVATGQIHAH